MTYVAIQFNKYVIPSQKTKLRLLKTLLTANRIVFLATHDAV